MYPILQPYQNQLQNLQNQMLSPTQAIQYVNGRSSADNYVMQPNSSVILMDSTMDRFYLKKSDASGACITEAYDFYKAEEDTKSEYVTRKEFEELKQIVKESRHEQLDGEWEHNDAGSRGNDERRESTNVSAGIG